MQNNYTQNNFNLFSLFHKDDDDDGAQPSKKKRVSAGSGGKAPLQSKTELMAKIKSLVGKSAGGGDDGDSASGCDDSKSGEDVVE